MPPPVLHEGGAHNYGAPRPPGAIAIRVSRPIASGMDVTQAAASSPFGVCTCACLYWYVLALVRHYPSSTLGSEFTPIAVSSVRVLKEGKWVWTRFLQEHGHDLIVRQG